MPTPTPCDRTQVGEKDDATEKLLLEMKTDREVLGETLDRASLDLRAKQVPPLHLITFLRPTSHTSCVLRPHFMAYCRYTSHPQCAFLRIPGMVTVSRRSWRQRGKKNTACSASCATP